MKIKFSIKLQYILFIIILITGVLIINTYLTIQNQQKLFKDEILKKAGSLAQKLARDAGEAILLEDDLSLFTIINSVKKEKGIIYVIVLDNQRIPIGHSDTRWLAGHKCIMNDEITLKAFNSKGILIQDIEHEGEKAYDVSFSIIVNAKKIGLIRIGFSNEPIKTAIKNITNKTLFVAAIAIIIGIIATIILTSIILQPIKILLKGVEKISQGNLNDKIAIKQKNEFFVLANMFNQMQDSIKKMMGSIAEKEAIKKEIEIASDIQKLIIPKSGPKIPYIDIAGYNKPAQEIGGDYFDFFQVDHSTFGTIIADVSGHGISAALIMVMVSVLFKINTQRIHSPSELLNFANKFLISGIKDESYVTMIYYNYNHKKKELILSNAGHLPLLIFRAREKKIEEFTAKNVPVGMFDNSKYHNKTLKLFAGDTIIAFTDGIIEVQDENDQLFGIELLKDIIIKNHTLSSNDLIKKILNAIEAFSTNTMADDKTIIIMKV